MTDLPKLYVNIKFDGYYKEYTYYMHTAGILPEPGDVALVEARGVLKLVTITSTSFNDPGYEVKSLFAYYRKSWIEAYFQQNKLDMERAAQRPRIPKKKLSAKLI